MKASAVNKGIIVVEPPPKMLECPQGHAMQIVQLTWRQGYVSTRTCALCNASIPRDVSRFACSQACSKYMVCMDCGPLGRTCTEEMPANGERGPVYSTAMTNTDVHERIGEYIIRMLTAVIDDVSITGNVVGMLKPDTSVEVLQVFQSLADDRLRARIADPPGYISLRMLSDSSKAWATPAPARLFSELRPAVGTYVITEAVAVSDSACLEGRIVETLEPGTCVKVLQVFHRSKDQRLRAFLMEPRGYISLQSTEDEPFFWAQPCLEVEERQGSFIVGR